MDEVEHKWHNKHERGVKDVGVELVGLQGAALALDVFYHAVDGSDKDEPTGHVKHKHVATPRCLDGLRTFGRMSRDAKVEDGRDDEEDAKEDKLHIEAPKHNVLPEVNLIGILGTGNDRTAYSRVRALATGHGR